MVKMYIYSFTDKGNCVAIDFGPRLFLVDILSIYLSKEYGHLAWMSLFQRFLCPFIAHGSLEKV